MSQYHRVSLSRKKGTGKGDDAFPNGTARAVTQVASPDSSRS